MDYCTFAIGCRKQATESDPDSGAPMCRECYIVRTMGRPGQIAKTEQPFVKAGVRAVDLIDPSIPRGSCGCGCGAPVAKYFKPGHDSRLKARHQKGG